MQSDLKEVETAPWRKECIEDVISTLEKLLEQAKNGEVTSVALALTMPGGYTRTAYSKTDNISGLIGALAVVNYRLLKSTDE